MCATAYINLPVAPPNLPEEYLCWFHYLSRIWALPMTCYAEGDKLRQLTGQYPNLLEYKRRYALPLECALRPEEALNYLRLSRVFLLRKTREKYPNQTHYVWVDFGYQRYPVYEGAAVNWDAVCQETICLAMVGGVPDTSMIVVPAGPVGRGVPGDPCPVPGGPGSRGVPALGTGPVAANDAGASRLVYPGGAAGPPGIAGADHAKP